MSKHKKNDIPYEEHRYVPAITSGEGENENGLSRMLEIEETLLKLAKSPVTLEPLIMLDGSPVINKGTLISIVGSEGSHKSRLAESFASVLLSSQTDSTLGFQRCDNKPLEVIYIDTERNTKSELPLALKNILNRVKGENESKFHLTSLKEFSRHRRLTILKEYLTHSRNSSDKHMVVILDVISDCITDFNNVEESLAFFDHIGKMVEDSDATFIAVIHKNPLGGKARGHVGTELENKASTSMHISNRGGVITLEFKKTRHSKPLAKISLKYVEQTSGLVELSKEEEFRLSQTKEDKEESLILAVLDAMEYDKPVPQKELLTQLKGMLNLSKNTIMKRLKESTLCNGGIQVDGEEGLTRLEIQTSSGKATTYQLIRS